MKMLFGVAVLLCSSLFLSGCMVRTAGPCLGYGCPAMGGVMHVRNLSPNANSTKAVTAKNAPSQPAGVHAGN